MEFTDQDMALGGIIAKIEVARLKGVSDAQILAEVTKHIQERPATTPTQQ